MKIMILTQGGKSIGLGHFYRSLAVVNLFPIQDVSFFVLVEDPSIDLKSLIPASISSRQYTSVSEILSQVDENCFVIYDGKYLDSSLMKRLREDCGTLMVIDDNHSQFLDADVIINHNLHASALGYEKYTDTTLMLGPQFALLRSAFLNCRHSFTLRSETKKVCISLGGSDQNNWSFRIYQYIKQKHPYIECSVIVGKANPHLETLKQLIKEPDNILFNLNDIEMVDAYKTVDILICSASTTYLEGLIIGIPMVVGAFAEDQSLVSKKIEESKTGLNLGNVFKGDRARWDQIDLLITSKDVQKSIAEKSAFLIPSDPKEAIVKKLSEIGTF